MRLLLTLCFLAASASQAQTTDAKGCVEPKVLSRMPGCVIARCDHKDFQTAEMARTASERGHMVEGEYEMVVYRCPKEKSPLELGRNTEAALKNVGFQIHYTRVYGPGTRFWLTAQKGAQWVKLAVVGDAYEMVAVKEKQMEQVMTADAGAWANQVNQTGRVSIYGINFDTAKATIRADSEAALNEVVKLLQANAGWAMVVAGHTDNVGAAAMNLTLSRQRAESVIAWLAAHGIDRNRLVAAGFGDTRPVGENTTEEGRQKNRRVDLVKLY